MLGSLSEADDAVQERRALTDRDKAGR